MAREGGQVKVYAVLQGSPDFGSDYVRRLHDGLRRYWPGALDFRVLTDTAVDEPGVREEPLWCPAPSSEPGYWCKMSLCHPSVTGDVLYLDLDTVPVGPLDGIARERMGPIALRTFTHRKRLRINSSVMLLTEQARAILWRYWSRDPERIMEEFRWGAAEALAYGDQGFIQAAWSRERMEWTYWQDWCPLQIESYKLGVEARGGLGRDTRLVVFHGKPRPHEIGWTLPERRAVA
jgi:hypothetical protein